MDEEVQIDSVLKETEPDVTIEDIETLFTDLLNQMTDINKKISILGKRLREHDLTPDIQGLEQEYNSLPVLDRPSWFQYVAEQAEAKKFASATGTIQSTTQNGHTQ
jgi:Zn-dependent M32 family carboxypeptidase